MAIPSDFDPEAETVAPDEDEAPVVPPRPRPLTRLPRLPTGALSPNPNVALRRRSSALREKMPRLPSAVHRAIPAPAVASVEEHPAPDRKGKVDALTFEVQQWVLSLARAFGGLRIYAENNARLRAYFHEALEGAARIFAVAEPIVITVENGQLLFRGTPVRMDMNENARTLARRLSAGGIERLVFKAGLDHQELSRFLQALSNDGFRGDREDAPLEMWTRSGGLPHIRFGEDESAGSFLSRSAFIPEPKAPVDAASILSSHLAAHPEALFELALELNKGAHTAGPGDPFAIARAKIEIGGIEAEIHAYDRKKSAKDLASRSIELLFQHLEAGREALPSSPVLSLFLRLFDALFAAGDFGVLASIVERARAMSEQDDRRIRDRGTRILEYLVDPPRLDRVIRTLNEHRQVAHELEFSTFVDTLVPFAAGYLLEQLDAFEYPEHAEWICEMLSRSIELEPDMLENVAPKLGTNALAALLAIGRRQPEAMSPRLVVDALEHADASVRKASVEILAAFPPGDADLWLEAMMRDPDERVASAADRVHAARNVDLGRALTQDAGVPTAFDDGVITQVTAQMTTDDRAEALELEETIDEEAAKDAFANLDEMHTLPATPKIVDASTPPKRKPSKRGRGRSK